MSEKDTSTKALDHFLWKYRVQVPGSALAETLDPKTGISSAYDEPELSPLATKLAKRAGSDHAVLDRESAYFHINNGGLELHLQEIVTAGYGSTFRVRYEMTNHGGRSAGEFDLPEQASSWLGAVLLKMGPIIQSSQVELGFTPYRGTPTIISDGVEVDTSPPKMTEEMAMKLATVAYLHKQAITFPTPKALRDYLRQHPKADPAKHEVEKKEKKEPEKPKKPEKDDHEDKGHGKDDHGGEKDDTPDFSTLGKKLADKVKGWGSKAVKALSDAPKAVHKFVEDDAHRRKVLMGAHKKVEHLFNLPTALIETAKDEVHEFKAAGSALKKLMKGGKLDKHDRHALKTVGTHLAITAAATAFTATSFGAGAAMFGKAMAKHVALKAVSNVLAKGHTLEELGHIGHGIQHVMDKLAAEEEKDKKADPMTTFAKMVTAAVAKQMEELDVAGIGDALASFSGQGDDVKPLPTKKASMTERLVERMLAEREAQADSF